VNSYFERNHPVSGPPKVGEAAFSCRRCRQRHAILGSKQIWSPALRKFKRYCVECYEQITKRKTENEN
jgi:hypothetical protein